MNLYSQRTASASGLPRLQQTCVEWSKRVLRNYKIKTYAATANRTTRRLTVFIVVVIEPRPLWSTHSQCSSFIGGQHWVKRLELMTCNSQQREREDVIRQQREINLHSSEDASQVHFAKICSQMQLFYRGPTLG